MAQDGFTAQDIRKTQLQLRVGRSEAVRLLKQGKGWKKPEPCKHILGFGQDYRGQGELLPTLDILGEEYEHITSVDKFNYCPLCGDKLKD